MERALTTFCFAIVLTSFIAACSDDDNDSVSSAPEPEPTPQPAPPAPNCAETIPRAVQSCLQEVNTAAGSCYFEGGIACDSDDPRFIAATDQLNTEIQNACTDGEFLNLSVSNVDGRLENACTSHADALSWRTFGGPQGAVWPKLNTAERGCLQAAYEAASQFMNESLALANKCLTDGDCSTAAGERAELAQAAVGTVDQVCPDLTSLIAKSPETYIDRAADQVDCILATTHDNTEGLNLNCGPSFAEPLPTRGEWAQLVLAEEKWGSRCGDGSDYAIYIRPAPEGEPLDRVLVLLQGGGLCLFEDDCRRRIESGLLTAMDDNPEGFAEGLLSSSPENPFTNWTRVYLPYCDQAVFAGGGVVEQFSDFEVNRFGSLNLRAGVRAARDIIWSMLDAQGDVGYRPDQIMALFGGFSAGAYGAMYNYHFMLDDILWPRTAAFLDAGGGLDNGGIGVRTLGDVKIPEWQVIEYLPPYCFAGECAVGPELYEDISPRLKQVPEQQILVLSNQKDLTQQGDAFFTDEAQWINAMRQAYCDTKDLNGIQWYLTSESQESIHVVSIRDEFYFGSVAGESMVTWFSRLLTDPDSLFDVAEEGNFMTDIPGSLPFPCDLP